MLTILQVGYPLAPVCADAAGGAEQVLAALDAALVEAGHRSLVLAPEGSSVRGELLAVPATAGPLDEAAMAAARRRHRDALEQVLATRQVDLVHLHGIDFHTYLPPAGPPALVTLHLPLAWYPEAALRPTRPCTWLHGVSASQVVDAPADLRLLPPISNGVRVRDFDATRWRHPFALALGRLCSEKGYDVALDAAHAADLPLVLAGPVFPYPSHRRWVAEVILPRLDRWRRWIGPVGFAAKRRLLARARCLVVPSRVAETSSLVAMEALASGTPVVAAPVGALPEIVVHGCTGFLAEGVDATAAAMRAAAALDRALCRHEAERRFDVAHTTRTYLERYATLARHAALAA